MLKRLLRTLINLYRKGISPYTPPSCIFVPTCSTYALEAIEKHGAFKGGLLALWRILRCNPFNLGGYDPVPETFTFKRQFKGYDHRKNRGGE